MILHNVADNTELVEVASAALCPKGLLSKRLYVSACHAQCGT